MSAPTTSSTVRVGRRLAPLYASAFTGGIALWVPVEKLFLDELGFTPAILGVMAALYAAAVPLLEVPSGILADRWSRRGVLVIGNLGALASVAVGGLSSGVAMYLVAAVLLGVYFAMQSGTLDAIVYDAVLEETGSSDTFEAVLGRLRVVSSAALVIGALAGGALAAADVPAVHVLRHTAAPRCLDGRPAVLPRTEAPRRRRVDGLCDSTSPPR